MDINSLFLLLFGGARVRPRTNNIDNSIYKNYSEWV